MIVDDDEFDVINNYTSRIINSIDRKKLNLDNLTPDEILFLLTLKNEVKKGEKENGR